MISKLKLFSFFIFLNIFISCSFDTSGINDKNLCGNGVVDYNEDCEQNLDLNADCQTLGYTGGILQCNPDICKFDVSQCGDLCGECQIGIESCFGNTVYKCIEDSSGCGFWQTEKNCSSENAWCTIKSNQAYCSHECINQCTIGEKQCYNSKIIQKCMSVFQELGSCRFWAFAQVCEAGFICEDTTEVACVEYCSDECDNIGEQVCSYDKHSVLECQQNGKCKEWIELQNCTTEEFCTLRDTDIPHCETCNQCSPYSIKCSYDKTSVLQCLVEAGTSCTYWDSIPCNEDSLCTESTGNATCSECVNCMPNTRRCSSDHILVEECTEDASGCTEWTELQNCSDLGGQVCRDTLGTPGCADCDICTDGNKMCSTDKTQVFMCKTDMLNCTYWDIIDLCNPDELKLCENNSGTTECTLISDSCNTAWQVNTLPYNYSTNNFDLTFSNTINFTNDDCKPNDVDAPDLFFSVNNLQPGDRITISNTGDQDILIKQIDSCNSNTHCNHNVSDRSDNTLSIDVASTTSVNYLFAIESDMDSTSLGTSVNINIFSEPDICTVNETEAPDSHNENNTPDASDIGISTATGSFCSLIFINGDIDCTKINIPYGGGSLKLWTSSAFDYDECSENDTLLTLYDPAGAVIASDDNSGIDSQCSLIDASNFPELIFVPEGTYVACVKEHNSHKLKTKSSINLELSTLADATLLLYEDFEGTTFLPINWSFETNRTPVSATWERLQETTSSNHYASITSDVIWLNDPILDYYSLATPELNLTSYSYAYLVFREKITIEGTEVIGSVSIDNGVITRIYATENNFSKWHYVVIDLSPYTSIGDFKLRFTMLDARNDIARTWSIDGVSVFAW